MRALLAIPLFLAALMPSGLIAQPSPHVAVEAVSLVMDEARLRRLGVDGMAVWASGAGVAGAAGQGSGNVLVAGRVGGIDVQAWLDLVRRERAVRRESTQRVVVLSGSAARLSSQHTIVGPYGQSASAGPELWVEPVALEGGQVRLRIWAAVGDVRPGAFGTIRQDVPVEGSTEVIVASGTPVVIASNRSAREATERGILSRGESRSTDEAWIVVTARIVEEPAEAFPMPEGIPDAWLRP